MPTNPRDIYEAYTLLLSELLGSAPHHVRYDFAQEDWAQRIEHLQNIANALDVYLLALGEECRSNAHVGIDAGCFRDAISNGLDDALGELLKASVAAREFETTEP